MHRLHHYRWWILLPLLFVILVPMWQWLGAFLGYDLLPAPDPEPPRFDSAWLAIPYYVVWYLILFFILLPGSLITTALRTFLPHAVSYRVAPAFVALLYCCVFVALRWSIVSLIRRLRSPCGANSKV